MKAKPVRPPKAKLLPSSIRKAPVIMDGQYEGVKPGRWYSHGLTGDRFMLHSAGIIPRKTLDHKGVELRRLTVKTADGDCVISHVDKDNMTATQRFLEHFGLTYTGQGIPAETQAVLFKLMEPKR